MERTEVDKKNILFVDCDGTVRKPKGTLKFINAPENQSVIPEAERALSIAKNKGFKIIGVTNQAGVISGKKTIESCIAEQQYTMKLFPQLSYIVFCPDWDGKRAYKVTPKEWKEVSIVYPHLIGKYRKPNNGMIAYCLIEEEIDSVLEKCVFVGDRETDRLAAKKCGMAFIDAQSWHIAHRNPSENNKQAY